MHAAVNAHVDNFLYDIASVGERVLRQRYSGYRGAGQREFNVPCPEELFQCVGQRSGHAPVRRGILGMTRCNYQGEPIRILLGCLIAVDVCCANRSHRTPEVVVVLAVPTADSRIGNGDVHLREKPGAVGDRPAFLSSNKSAQATAALSCGGFGVEQSDFRLFRRAPRPFRAPNSLVSLKSLAHCALVRFGGPYARNCDGFSIAKGFILAIHGAIGVAGGGGAPGVI